MKLLLDECVPPSLARLLAGHDVIGARQAGLAGVRNGELLRRAAAAGFEVFITVDKSLRLQQNLANVRVGIILLLAVSNAIGELQPLVPELLRQLPFATPGRVIVVK